MNKIGKQCFIIWVIFHTSWLYAEPNIHHPIRYLPNSLNATPIGFSPSQIQQTYGFNNISAQGSGQIIAIVDAFDNPNIEADLNVFNSRFNLPACTTLNGCFKKIYANKTKPPKNIGWCGEIALDVEWAHAIAPAAKIYLVEAASTRMKDMYHAVSVAIQAGANVVSMSWGSEEFAEQTTYDTLFKNPQVSFVASTGDWGSNTCYPATSPYVLAVGGTSLNVDNIGNYQGETAWSGSGGGLSKLETWPSYQQTLPTPQSQNRRGIPDVAYNADPYTGFLVYNSIADKHGVGWRVVGGTSAGAPQWAALIAIANSAASHNIGGNIHAWLYAAAHPSTGFYNTYFYDIDTGTNGTCGFLCTAQNGYDYVTGLGSPQADLLIQGMSRRE